jgi:hypothetical protein
MSTCGVSGVGYMGVSASRSTNHNDTTKQHHHDEQETGGIIGCSMCSLT